ncbi:MAG: DUF4065 domain-containing protein [Peptoniphilus harei]|nr:DUF4065 domain-containing protein [Peptoniphilus harei]MDU7531782.1 DUF4065 domain-containing protein [Peptoniphilus harei]
MTYSIDDINIYIINYAYETNRSVTNLKLQKILYFLYGFYHSTTKNVLFDEDFEAWAYGPVVRESYINYSMYGAEIIPPHNNYLDLLFDEKLKYDRDYNSNYFDTTFDSNTKSLINKVLNLLLDIPVMKLVELSHSNIGPWYSCYEEGRKNIIDKRLIFEYFDNFSNGAIK